MDQGHGDVVRSHQPESTGLPITLTKGTKDLDGGIGADAWHAIRRFKLR
jgi:hypothetical protein